MGSVATVGTKEIAQRRTLRTTVVPAPIRGLGAATAATPNLVTLLGGVDATTSRGSTGPEGPQSFVHRQRGRAS